VDEVLSGSVVAVSYIDFTKNAPNQAVDAAMEQLHTNGRDMFADSGLPSKYGWLLSYSMGQSKADMIADDKGEVQIQAMNFPAPPTRAKSNSKLSLTITIAIAVGGLLMILAIVCAVMAMRHRRARQQQQQAAARAKKPAPKVLDKIGGGVGGTTSGYLADLDGMLDDDNSDKIKSSTGKVGLVGFNETQGRGAGGSSLVWDTALLLLPMTHLSLPCVSCPVLRSHTPTPSQTPEWLASACAAPSAARPPSTCTAATTAPQPPSMPARRAARCRAGCGTGCSGLSHLPVWTHSWRGNPQTR
jgi:hypothetical protein